MWDSFIKIEALVFMAGGAGLLLWGLMTGDMGKAAVGAGLYIGIRLTS